MTLMSCKDRQPESASAKEIQVSQVNSGEWLTLEAQNEDDMEIIHVSLNNDKTWDNKPHFALRFDIQIVQKDGPVSQLELQWLRFKEMIRIKYAEVLSASVVKNFYELGKKGVITVWSQGNLYGMKVKYLPLWEKGTKIKKITLCANPTVGLINRLWPIEIETFDGRRFSNPPNVCTLGDDKLITPKDIRKVDQMND